tara:strand:- start:214 stop:540 length:327 start_codon:yes stop_codon:yes gene_type:complete
MSDYLFIQSQDPFTETRAGHQYRLAQQLREAGHGVTVLLVQNGVVPARQEAQSQPFDSLLKAGVKLLADEFSLRQREINYEQLKAGITVCDMGAAIDVMLAGHKVIWH